MKLDLNINFNPSDSELTQIEQFLLKEKREFNEGFYCNWPLIKEAYEKKRIISFHCNNECIGFVEWRDGDFVIDIDRFVIRREFRKQGLGKYFFEKIFEFFRKKKAKVIGLDCEPHESQWFWKKMGFIQFPAAEFWKELTFYKNLIEVQETTDNPSSLNKVELWNLEPSRIRTQKPKWCWDLDMSGKPIIQPCNHKWQLKYTKNAEIFYEGTLGRFPEAYDQILFSPFLFIENGVS